LIHIKTVEGSAPVVDFGPMAQRDAAEIGVDRGSLVLAKQLMPE